MAKHIKETDTQIHTHKYTYIHGKNNIYVVMKHYMYCIFKYKYLLIIILFDQYYKSLLRGYFFPSVN